LAILVLRTKKFVEVPLTASVDLRAASQGPGAGQLNSPRGLAVAPDGSLYVADCQNSRIDVFSPEGVFKKSFGAAAAKAGEGKPGEFSEPSGVAVAPNGVVYVADTWNQRVQKFSADGDYLGQYQGAPYNFYSPRNVATDSAGNLYVADTGHSMVKAFSADGKPLAELGGRGSGEGQFSEVFGVAVDSQGESFAADPGNGRLHKFGPLPNAGLLKEVDVPGWRAAPPFWPQVAINAADEVFVTDNRGHRIWVYDSGLVYRGSIVCGQDPGPSPALGAAFSKDGKLWISDMGRGMLLRLTGFDPLPARP
ncbi:MAG TPA: NHL repeat-containing protein, partial [bacterium]|nr:NHL repeat-containing protein [bacterium]